ncbi:MAG TPA: Rrf2 family transcriptional regulator [Bacteroidota bacterium]|nr:Rrf2 family transcriptional regulator [Bacteroidota bacterium]
MFSRQCEYALQAVSYLALQPEGELTSIKELTGRLNIPYHFLGKILQNLAQKEILLSQKGRDGGFALAKPAKKITMYKIVEAIDGIDFTRQCVMGFAECSSKHPCAVHTQWKKTRTELYELLSKKNIAEMALENRRPEYQAQ